MATRVLISDDDLEILELLRFTFENEGYQVYTASDGEEGLKSAISLKPDVIILDVNMPKLSGFEVCEKIRENRDTCLIPIIMLTSLTRVKDRITGIKLGANEYLSKPFEPLELVARVEGLVKRMNESVAANPLTGLPGNVSIESEIRKRLEEKTGFAVIYADADNFKAFNDKYGFAKGDGVIKMVSDILKKAMLESGGKNDFLGHIGGEDFIIVTDADAVERLCSRIIADFDASIPQQYDSGVRERGYLWGVDRQGQEVKFPIMTVSLGCVMAGQGKYQHYSQVVEKSKELLKRAKAKEKSAFEVE